MNNIHLRWLIAIILLLIFIAVTAAFALPSLLRPNDADAPAPRVQVIIDPGHGGEDGGAVGADGTTEKDLNLSISLMLRDMLVSSGVNVIMTRTEDVLLYDRNVDYHGRKKVLDLQVRLDICRANPDALFVSIHMNAFPQKKYDGLQVYYPAADEVSAVLARDIQDSVRAALQPENLRRAKATGSNIFLLDKTPGRAVLVECGFLSNIAECSRLCNTAYQRQLALVLYGSIMKYLSDGLESP